MYGRRTKHRFLKQSCAEKNLMSSENGEGSDFVRALARGLAVIECFDEEHAHLTLSEVARRTELTRPSARRALLTLQSLGYVSANGDQFRLTPRTLRLGYAYLSSEPLWTLAQPILHELCRESGQTCSIAILDRDEIMVVARASAKRITHDEINIGFRWPAYQSAIGRVLLAALDKDELEIYLSRTKYVQQTPQSIVEVARLRKLIEQARERGWAVAHQEMDIDLRSLGVPIHDRSQLVIAAMNINVRAQLVDAKTLESDYLPLLQAAASKISEIASLRPIQERSKK